MKTGGSPLVSLVTRTFSVSALAFEASADTIQKALSACQGIENVRVSLKDKNMRVTYNDDILSPADIIRTVRNCGYDAYLPEEKTEIIPVSRQTHTDKRIPVLLILSAAVILCALFHVPSLFILLFLIPGILTARDIFIEPDTAHRQYILTRTAAAFGIFSSFITLILNEPSWPFVLTVLLLCLKAVLLEKKPEPKKKSSFLRQAENTLPDRVRIYANHKETTAELKTVLPDDILIIRPEETVPVDGRVVKGRAAADSSLLTGADEPTELTPGMMVYAGTKILSGNILVRVIEIGETTALSRYVTAAEKTAGTHEAISPLTKVASALSWYLLAGAAAAFCAWYISDGYTPAALTALSILAVSDLTAFDTAANRAADAGINDALDAHILFTGSDAMKKLAAVDAVCMETENILQEEDFRIDALIPLKKENEQLLGYIAYALLADSPSPFARALIQELRKEHINKDDIAFLQGYSRSGRLSFLEDSGCSCGSAEAMEECGIDMTPCRDIIAEARAGGQRILFFRENKEIIGYALAHKPLLKDSGKYIKELMDQGIEVTVFADGTPEEAETIRNTCRPDAVYVRRSREEKKTILMKIRQSHTCTAYLSAGGFLGFEDTADLFLLADAGASPAQKGCDILFARKGLKALVTAVSICENLRNIIEKQQILIILGHIGLMFLIGFIMPYALNINMPPYIAVLIPMLVHYIQPAKKA